mgnify:CR=1 FL=1
MIHTSISLVKSVLAVLFTKWHQSKRNSKDWQEDETVSTDTIACKIRKVSKKTRLAKILIPNLFSIVNI